MSKKILCFIIVSAFLVTGSVFAQNIQELQTGSVISGVLAEGQEIWYSVRTRDSGILIVQTTGQTDTYLEAYDSDRKLLMEDDDGGEGYNAKIEMLSRANTVYLFKLRGYNETESGRYQISADYKPMPSMSAMRIGVSQDGNIVSREEYWFSIQTTSPGLLIVETTGDTDTFLEAYNENFHFLASDDDGGEDLNARIELAVSAGKTFYFKLKAYGDESGPYRISANVRSFPNPVQMRLGTFQSGNIASGADYWFSVRPTRRGRVAVETTSSLDTFMEAYTSSYELITSDDDSGEGLNARIEIPVEANQTYIFRVKGYDSNVTGPYRIIATFEN
ncbi:MAG: hypothetical protein FWD26_05040 [Treponema sp.]|nr:hypothetical protein [Treponema sp.]